MRKVLKWLGRLFLLLIIPLVGFVWWNWDFVERIALGGVKDFDTVAPKLPPDLKHPAVLVFSKTNGFRHGESIPVATQMFGAIAKEKGWSIFQTENGATFSPELLSRFDAVVFNNVSGDPFTPEQKAAFKAWIENGGGFVGVHASGGDYKYNWDWYVNTLIGAQFKGHPLNPQFQKARVYRPALYLPPTVQNHPATKAIPFEWSRIDEWYSFETSVRRKPGFTVLATLDETTYSPKGPFGQDLRMGADHPIIWWHCVGKGRSFYSALGHTPESYREPEYKAVLAGAMGWAMRLDGEECGVGQGVKAR